MKNELFIRLDEVDKKILIILLRNSRINLTELSEIIGSSYPMTRDRVNNLIKKGVITQFYPVLQFPGIGLRRYMSVYLSIKHSNLQEIIKNLKENNFITEILELQGKYNVSIFLTTNFVKEAYGAVCWIQQICGDDLLDLIVMPTYIVSNMNRNFFLETDYKPEWNKMKTGYFPLFKKQEEIIHLGKPVKLKQEDFKILNYLRTDSEDPLEEISQKIKINDQKIDYKIKKYLKECLITYFTIDIDTDKLGYNKYLVFFNLRGSREGKDKIIKELENINEAFHYYEYFNYWELVVTFCVKDAKHLNQIMTRLQNKYENYIKQYTEMPIIKKHKMTHYPDVEKVYPKV